MATTAVIGVRRLYGAHPLQLLLILGSFALVGYALWLVGFAALWNPDTWWQSIALWFVGAALAHDLVLFPAYAAADRILVAATTLRSRRRPPLTNFVRVPLLAVGLVTLIFFPGVIEQGADSYHRATGQTQEPFLHRWLVVCAVILLSGAIAYLVARLVAGGRTGSEDGPPLDAPDVSASGRGRAPTDAGTPVWAVVVLAVLMTLAARQRHRTRRRGP